MITESHPFGGAQRNTLLTVAGLARMGLPTDLACGPGGRLIPAAREAGVGVHVIETLVRPVDPLRDARALVALLRLFRAQRYDVVHTHSTKGGLLGRLAAWLARVPLIVHTIHGVPFELDGRAGTRVYLAMERLLAPLTDRVICVGEVLRQEVAGWGVIPVAKLATVYSGIDFDAYAPQRPAAAVKRALGLTDAWPIVGAVGRLAPQKAPGDLVEAIAHLAPRWPGIALLLVGDGELRPELERRALERGVTAHVRFLGDRDDVPDLLPILDVYAMSSRYEGVGRALTEAMYTERPIVATPVDGVTEIIRDGETGLLVPPGDPVALAAAIERLTEDRALAARLGAAARQRAIALMDSRRMVAAIHELYEEDSQHVRDRRRAAPLI